MAWFGVWAGGFFRVCVDAGWTRCVQSARAEWSGRVWPVGYALVWVLRPGGDRKLTGLMGEDEHGLGQRSTAWLSV
jgi:hypothetical protein